MLRIASVVFAAGIAIAARAPAARADSSIVITLTPAGAQLADYLHLSVDQLKQNEEDKFNALFQTANLPALLSAFASTTAIADRGLGVDYGVLGTPLMVGVVANGAVPTDSSLSGNDERVIGGLEFNSKGVMNVEAEATTIPLEGTSGFSLGDLVVIYGGGGLDLTFATSIVD